MATGTHTIRVRYGESDQMGVANHAAYITWFEECRIEMLRSLGVSYRTLEESGVMMPVIAGACASTTSRAARPPPRPRVRAGWCSARW